MPYPKRPPTRDEVAMLGQDILAQWELESWWVDRCRSRDLERNCELRESNRVLTDSKLQRSCIKVAEKVAYDIERDIDALDHPTSGRPSSRARILKQLVQSVEPFELAYLLVATSVSHLLASACGTTSMAVMASNLANAVELELKLRTMRALDPELPLVVSKVLKDSRATLHHRRKTFITLFNSRSGYRVPSFFEDADAKVKVGNALIELLLSPAGTLVMTPTQYWDVKRRDVRWGVVPSEELVNLFNRDMDWEWLRAHTQPLGITVYPPGRKSLDNSTQQSMLLTPEPPTLALNLLRGKSKQYINAAIDRGAGVEYLVDSLTALENTPLRVNSEVLSFIKRMETQLRNVGILQNLDKKLPNYPWLDRSFIPVTDRDRALLREYKQGAAKAHDAYWHNVQKMATEKETLRLATKMSEYPEFYLQHIVDFRGRLYTVNRFLSFQGTKLSKCLLEFSEPGYVTPGNTNCPGWLALLDYGYRLIPRYSRLSFHDLHSIEGYNDRAQLSALVESSLSDLTQTKQLVGSEALPFLAWCLEVQRVLPSWGQRVDCHHPVRRDATCSSIQHMAALAGEEGVLKLTNCWSGDEVVAPRDIYSELVPDAESRGLQRSWIKTFVMTYAYQSTDRTRRQNLADAYEKHFGKPLDYEESVRLNSELKALATASLGKVIDLQQFLLKVFTEGVARRREPALAVSPLGWLIDSTRYKRKTTQYRVNCLEATIKLRYKSLSDDDLELDVSASRRGWVANIIHGMDASLMQLMLSKTRHQVMTIHDCIVTRPNEATLVQCDLRAAFGEMYRRDPKTGVPAALKKLLDFWVLEEDNPEIYKEALKKFQGVPPSAFSSMPYFFL